jgi:LuxR family transcriptional regulator, maltose regulon positive regulatory protein
MLTPILATKLYVPPPRPEVVLRPNLIERLNEGLSASRKLTLISAPAGFGKTTLVSEWAAGCKRLEQKVRVAWLSLDEGDNDPTCFLTYLVAALQTVAPKIGQGVLGILNTTQSQPPPIESILTTLLNEITSITDDFIFVLDDYHVIDAKPVDGALTFLIEHMPPQMHLIITTREDPNLPLARLRARGQLTELRASDLRFTLAEAAEFLNRVMGFNLSTEDIAALEARTEGWIAGLQLAAISMQGRSDAANFIKSFTGSHHFILDYLVEEVLQKQSEGIQTFLLRTSILDRLSGPLCDAVMLDPSVTGQETLEYLDHSNLFIVPLDDERHWYRYHHLFADLLRQRLRQSSTSSPEDKGTGMAELHIRASAWYEDNALEIESFQHATAANDIEHAVRLIEGQGMPLHFRGAAVPILNWMESLPNTILDARPVLWVTYASATLAAGLLTGVEEKLQAAETALNNAEPNDETRDLTGRIASIRATLAVILHQVDNIIAQSRRALEYLRHDNLAVRSSITWMLGHAYHLQGDLAAASQAYTDSLSVCESIGNNLFAMMAAISLGNIQEAENQLPLAAQTYRHALKLAGDAPPPPAWGAYLGLGHILYEWNDLDAAQQHAQQSLLLARQIENTDSFVVCEVFLARLKLARGDTEDAAVILADADRSARQHNFANQLPVVAASQVLLLLQQGHLAAAAHLAQTDELPVSQARVHLAQGNSSSALALLEAVRRQAEAKGRKDERLKVMIIQAIALQAHGELNKAEHILGEALALAEPGGFIRIFVDEGKPMAHLLSEAAAHGIRPDYVNKLLAAFQDVLNDEGQTAKPSSSVIRSALMVEPLSQRELKILELIAQGLSNREISERLFLALSTVKGHNRNIFDKLQVQSRTEAVASARKLGLL